MTGSDAIGSPEVDLHSARAYFLQVVIPEYETFLETLDDGVLGMRRDLRALSRAAEACLHMVDHAARDPICAPHIEGAPSTKKYLARLMNASSEFAATRDIANLFKHRTIGRPNPAVTDLRDIDERWVLLRFLRDDQKHHYATTKAVLVHLSDSTSLLAEQLIFDCVQMWAHELVRLGVIPQVPSVQRRTFLQDIEAARPSITIACEADEPMEAKPLLLIAQAGGSTIVQATTEIFDAEVEINWRIYTSRFAGPRVLTNQPPTILRIRGGAESIISADPPSSSDDPPAGPNF
jgi:hypothetical protein